VETASGVEGLVNSLTEISWCSAVQVYRLLCIVQREELWFLQSIGGTCFVRSPKQDYMAYKMCGKRATRLGHICLQSVTPVIRRKDCRKILRFVKTRQICEDFGWDSLLSTDRTINRFQYFVVGLSHFSSFTR